MGIKVTGIESTVAMLQNDARLATSAALRGMRREAKRVMDLSIANAPVDVGNLEAAHKVEEVKIGRDRTILMVGVDPNTPAEHGKTVGDYADEMHEAVYNLGPLSLEKQRSTGRDIGRKFLERAFEERERKITPAVEADVEDAI